MFDVLALFFTVEALSCPCLHREPVGVALLPYSPNMDPCGLNVLCVSIQSAVDR